MPTCARPLPRCASRRSRPPFRSSPRGAPRDARVAGTPFAGPRSRIAITPLWIPAGVHPRESGGGNEPGVLLPLSRSALRRAEPIEALLLLVAERSVKLREGGLDRLHGAQHRIEPLLHRLQAADRRERSIGGAIRAQLIDRLGCGVLQVLERAALRPIRLHGAFDPLQRQACDARCTLAADLRQIALRLLLIGIILGAERIEACLLLVVERLIEL